jgi:hypothetical protein
MNSYIKKHSLEQLLLVKHQERISIFSTSKAEPWQWPPTKSRYQTQGAKGKKGKGNREGECVVVITSDKLLSLLFLILHDIFRVYEIVIYSVF